MTEEGSVTFVVPQSVTKSYTLKKVPPFSQSGIPLYEGDINSVLGIAYWFYTNHLHLNPENLQISIIGGWHQTFPNQTHISVKLKYTTSESVSQELMNPNFNSNIFHFSLDHYGSWYPQGLEIPQYRRPNVVTPPLPPCSVPPYGGDKNIKSIRRRKKWKGKKTLRLIKEK